ncbi:MAG: histidinol-phosphate transaminase [Pseudomonadota bacterium]|nr:histidinol-phosphate transaminase [Pseudomonadota bacterium]
MPVITPRPAVQPLVRYTSSLKGRREGRVIRLSVNEGALGPSPRVAAALDRVKDDLHRYPPLGLEPLVEAIGAHHGIDDADRLVIGCGSDELLSCLCQAYVDPGDEVIVTQYGFLLYRHLTLMAGGVPKVAEDHDFTVSVDNILALVSERTRIVFLANPNNPTGTYLPQREVQRLRDSLPESVLLVVDAAYAEYVQRNDYSSGKAMVEAHENVVMLRTFSKFHGLAGLRIGWAYCPADIAATLATVKPPYGVSLAAVEAGAASLGDHDFQERSLRHNQEMVPWFSARMTALGLHAEPTVANFVMLRFPRENGRDADAARLFLDARNILVRKLDDYGLPDHVRVSMGTRAEMDITVAAIAEFLRTADAANG